MLRDSGENSGERAVRELVVSIFLKRADMFQYLGDDEVSSHCLTPARMSHLVYFGSGIGGW
jgi:hypothetical protein